MFSCFTSCTKIYKIYPSFNFNKHTDNQPETTSKIIAFELDHNYLDVVSTSALDL